MADLKIKIAGSFEFTGKLLLKLSADFAFQNFFSKSVVDLFIGVGDREHSGVRIWRKD